MSISRKFQRSKSKYTLSQKIISAVTAAGFIMQPIVGFAQAITKADDAFKNTIINKGNGVTDIWADRVVGNSAVNVFKDFQLDANNIANMYFNELNRTEADAANLVNFVNSRIDINGTVNAIQNSQIGGNLFFLSKDGMAVGKSGVINTGSLYVMTPTQDFMENMQRVVSDADVNTAAENIAHITNITTDAASWQSIPLNSSGTITVLGKVNAVNEVRMRAAKIGVGKNVDDSVVDNVAAGGIAAENAHIKTGITDFSNIVNINYKDESGNDVAVNSGITNLTATKTGSGDIVLEAYVDGATKENDLEVLPVVGATLGPIAETVENTFVEQDFNASVDVYGTVETTGEKGDININATAVNSNADFDEKLNDYKANNNDVAQLANVKAEVNIDGTVQAADNVTVKAEAINRYIDNSGAFAKANIAIASGTPITGDIAYSVLNTEANVNITSEGSVESENGNVDIDAKAETLAASAASVTALKFKAAGGTTGANVPAVSVLYTGADNKANVTVEGNVNAAKDISIDADADMKVDAENKMGIKGKMGNQFVVGVTVAGAENSASVHIKDEDNSNNVIDAVNDLSVNANATSDFTSGTSIKAPEASAMAVAVNVTDFNSNANVNIDTDLTAGNDLTVKADNIITDDNVIAESTIGSGKYVSAATQVVTGHVEQKKGEVKEWIGTLAGKISAKLQGKLSGSDDADIPSLQLSEIFKAGATVNYSGQTHGSNVTIGENTTLNAGKKMDIEALTKIEDAHITATGTTASYNDAYPAEATLNAAVLVNNMDNSSSVVIKDAVTDEQGTEHKAILSADDGVDINASTRFEYNRIANMIQDVKDAAAQIKNAVSGLDGAIKSDFDAFLGNLDAQIGAWESAFKTADETFATSDSGVLAIGEAATAGLQVLTALNNLNTMLDGNEGGQVAADVKATIQGASDILTGALAFADPNSYGNFAAASASKGSSGDTGAIAGHHPSAINGAGTVMVNNVDSVSKVEVGSNSVIASNGKVNLNAENYMKDVSLGGLNTVPLTNSGGGTAASIGATVNYSDFNTDTIVAVNDGANISGGDINIAGSNEIDHVSVAGGAGMGPSDETGSNGIVLNGMFSFVNGSSDILTVVDDGAILKADQKQYTETVEGESGSTEETKTSTGNISISGHNDTNIVNVAAGLNLGSGSGAIGMGLAYNDFAVKNIAGVADISEQINNLYSYKNDDGSINVDEVEELKAKLVNEYTASKSTDENRSISAYGFNVDAATEGSIQSVSVAASASKNDDTGETSFFGKIKGSISNTENKLLGSGGKLDTVTGRIFGTESGKANDFFNMGSNTHGANAGGINLVGGTSGKGGFMPSFSIAGSGSVSMNMLDNATQAIVDNAKISMKSTDGVNGDIRVTARDTAYAGAYSGAAALQWKSGGSASDTSVGFSGAAGVNDIDNVIKATISNSVIDKAGTIDTLALSGGEQLALGLGLNVAKSGSTSGYTGNAAVSVNLIDHEVEALHENNTVEKAEDVNVSAYARDIENTGGGSLGAGQQKVGVGATVGVAMLNNNITAGIKGGEYKNVGNVDVEALNALQNITVGIAAGLTLPSSGSGASAVVEGAGVYNEVHNTTNAFIKGDGENSKAVIRTVDGGSVNVTAQDVAIDESSLYEQLLADGLADGKEEIAKRMGDEFDISGQSELAGIDTSAAETELNKNKKETETKEEVSLDKTGGSSIITVAGGVAATTGKGSGGAAVAITDIQNNYAADIEYANITTETLKAYADSSSNIVTVAGGIGASAKGSGVGSVSWNDVDNTAKVNIKNSVVKAQSTTATAANAAQMVSVGGQISVGGKAGVGAVLSYVGLDNSTEANIVNTTFDKRADDETDGTSVKAEATNTSDSYNIGAGVSAAGTAAVSGTVVVTQTHGTAGAVMDGVTINNAKAVTADALDDTNILSVIGSVAGAGTAAVGGGVAYTEIGGVSDDKEKAEQHVTAEIKNSTINSDGADSTVEVKAKDEARVINVAIGVGGAGNVAVQGASATTLINKTTGAEMNNTSVDKDETGSKKADVTVDAQNASKITSSADVAAAAGSGAGVGAGIAVNRIIQQTNAAVNGGTMNVNNLTVNANATPQITNIGVGVGVAGSGAGVTGSVAVNMIENNVTARIGSGATIVADGTVGVVATSDEQIANYAGQASVAGTGAAVGLSVSYNELTGNTTAIIDGDTTSVSASGGDALEVKDTVDDGAILDKFADEELFEAQDTLGNDRKVSEYNGVAVSASSTHAIKSFLVNGGVAGEGAAVNGTVNVNQIGGSTKAAITDADINTAGTAGDVNVIAHDYTNSAGLVGSASVAGVGAGVGLGSDTNTVSREVTAEVVGRTDSDGNAASVINAGAFNVEAEAQQGISSLTVGLGVGGIGAGVSNATSVALLKGKTTASVADVNITADSVDVLAKHGSRLNTLGVVVGAGGVGAGVGIGVSVLNENSETAAETTNSNITINDGRQENGDVNINADNDTKVNYQLYSTGGGLAGVAGAIGVSNVNSKVNTTVSGTVIGSETTGQANDINIGAENNINFTNYSGSAAGGGVGVGVGVAVNTIDSQVNTSVNYSELNAVKDINVTAKENRTVNQMAVNAGVGAVSGGANVMITNIGSAIESTYGSGLQTDDDGNVVEDSSVNVDSILKEANDAVEGNKLQDGYTMGVDVNTVPEIKAGKGTDNASKIKVDINGTELNAGNKVTAEAVADTNVSMDAIQAGGGAFANVSGTVGILDVNRNSIINISNTIIDAKDLAVNTSQKGNSGLDIYQGGFGGAASIGAAYGSAASSGVNNINVSDSDFTVTNDIDINAKDESSTEVNAIGVTLSAGGAASIVVAQGTNDSSTTVNISDTDITAHGNIDINAERQAKDENGNKTDSLSVSAIAGSGGLLFAGAGVGATANEYGTVGAVVTGGSSFTAGNAINITALNAPSVKAVTGAVAGSMVVSGAITVAEANIGGKDEDEHLETYVNISDGNSFTADSLMAEAKADAVQSVDMNGISVSAALWPTGSVQANTGGADIYSDVDVTVGKNVFKGNQDEPAIDLNINGINNVTQKVSAKGISVSTFVATGTNIAETNSVLNTHVTANGSQAGSNIETVDINADSKVTVDSSSRGDGGAIADISPYAAMVKNNIVTTTAADVSGNWTVAGDMNVNALHENAIDINADALKASVVGLSGVHSDNDIKNDTSVNFNNANVTTSGSQNISARNDIAYNAVVTGSGYGVAQGAAVWAEDDITSDAEVNVNSSKLDAKSSIDINALTGDEAYNGIDKPEAAVNKEVTIKSAGVVAGTYAESTDTINFTNNINIGNGSSIKTTGTDIDNADITITAADRTNFNDIVTADTQGGVIGAAGTKLTNNITRTNNINVGGTIDSINVSDTIDSNYDANFDAGDSSVLNLTLKSNAYNKTAAPLATNPSISGVVTQNSAIDFASGSTVKSFRNINAAAGVGDTTVAKESKTWRWVDGGETGTGSISSTSDGTLSGDDAKITTTVTVDGTLEAGKNHQLDIIIDYAENGKTNLEAAFDKYGDDLKLSELGQAVDDAQNAYNNNQDVKDLQAAVELLNAAKEQQANNEIIKDRLQGQINNYNAQKQTAESNQKTAQDNLNSYIADSLTKYNEDLKKDDKEEIDKIEFVKLLEAGKTDYAADYTTKNQALTEATNAVNEIIAQITAKQDEMNGYADYNQTISNLETRINELKAKIGPLENAIKAAQENYDEALKKGITEDVVNHAIFNGHIGDENDTYVTVNVPDWYKNQYGSAAEQIGMIDYAASLLDRMNELIKMSQQYSGTDVGAKYTAELTRIQSDLQALGLLTVDSVGNIGIAEGASSVPTIELKDLMVSGGNVNISADTLNGKGNVTAHGDPSVKIINNTDFFLRVNDVKIDSDGGKVSHNDVSINPTGEGYKYNGVGITAKQGDSANGNNAQITIRNTTGTKASDSTLYTPDIGIYGEIYNPYGNIKIENDNNSIYVSGEYTEDGVKKSGSIKGRTINLTAGGSVTQGYTDEIYNVAGDPKNALDADYITAIQNALVNALGNKKDDEGEYYAAFDSIDKLAEFLTGLTVDGKVLDKETALQAAKQLTGQVNNSRPGIAAGGAIYINAASINVNGTLQSGFEEYKLAINRDKAAGLIEAGNTTGKDNLTYEDFMNNTWLVTAGETGAYYDTTKGEFVYGVQAWYNPITNEIFTEDIEQAGGGRIYLTGAIANTNASGGKLVVLDGGSDYTIDGSVANAGKYTFKLGSINAETVDGRIEINDTSSGQTVKTVYTNADVDDNGKATYNPTKGQYYNWSNGTESRVTTSYKHVSDSSWWGLSSSSWESVVGQLDEVTKDQMQVGEPVTTDGKQLDTGNVITNGSVNGYTQLGTEGSGTTAVTGSTAKNDKTLYQIMFERKGKPKQGKNDAGELLYLDANGELTTSKEGTTPYYLRDENGKLIYETVISDKVTTTKKKGLLGLWGKTVTTEWKETSGVITAYNFGLKADNPIGIEFVGYADGSRGTITSNSDILLGGDIRMGQVNITSGGSINHVGDATVISDNAEFNAHTGIDVIQKNVNNALTLNAKTAGGNINIQALAANTNNMVYIDNVSTGAGNVRITAEGSLLNYHDNVTSMAADTAVVSGDSITLQSYGGSIGTKDDRLLIDGDVSYVADSDKNHGAINANAAGSVYLTEVNGNMYLGEIVAEDGNVVLEVTGDGAGFVDAIVNNDVMSESDQDRIAAWKEMGLLDDGTADAKLKLNSNVNQLKNLEAAAGNGSFFMDGKTTLTEAQEQGKALVTKGQEFVKLMQGGSEAVQAARKDLNAKQGALNEAIAALGNDAESKDAYKNALEAYNAAYDAYTKAGAAYEQDKANFIENSGFKDNVQAVEWLYNYEAIGNAEADNYGWTQQQLLYAVQDTVINPAAGSVSDVKTANVTGNNITFISDTGNLGVVDDQASSIDSGNLTKLFTGELEDKDGFLEKLASARAGDVTWGDKKITIKRTTPVSVKLNSDNGTVTVANSSGDTPNAEHIYLLAKDSVLNADEFAANDLRLSGQKGINVGSVTGDKIILEGGSGDIGYIDKNDVDKTLQAMQVTLNSNNSYISANAAGNIMLEQVGTGNFTLGSIAGTNVDITANGNIVSRTDDIGYINASDTINLVSAGGIGTTTKGLRIKNSGAVVNTDVQDAISIEAVQDGTLILATIEQTKGGVTVESEGTIMLGREDDGSTEDTDESVTGSIDAKGDVTLHAEDDIIISGKLHVNATDNDTASDNGTLQLHSNTGDIVQTTDKEDKNIVAANVGIAAVGGDVELDNQYNIIKKVDLQAVGGSLGLTVSNPDGFYVDMGGFTNKQGGDIKLTNSNGSVNITTEDIAEPAQKDPAKINGSLIVTANKVVEETEANVNNYGIIKAAGNINFNAEDNVNNEEALIAGRDADINFDAGNDVNNESAVNAGADVNFDAGNDVNNESTVSAGAGVDFDAGNDVNNESTVNAGTDVSFGAGNDVNNESTVNAGADVSFGAGNDIINNDIVDAGRNVNFNAAEDIYNNSTVNADETIEFTAVDGVINSDTVNGKDVIMQAIEQELENILAKDSVTLNGDRIHGQNITQNTEADGDLIINTDSNSGSGPIESLVIDKIDANDKSVFTELWAVEADITTVDDKMDFNDIMIEENAWLENSGTLATIYGNVPVKDDDANVHIYQSYPSMYVNFIDADTVETDGRLLSLDDYWYAYDQRFTAENHLRWQHGRYLDEDWKQAYGYGLSLHNRYGLIDYQEFTETNAGADEVAVEA